MAGERLGTIRKDSATAAARHQTVRGNVPTTNFGVPGGPFRFVALNGSRSQRLDGRRIAARGIMLNPHEYRSIVASRLSSGAVPSAQIRVISFESEGTAER